MSTNRALPHYNVRGGLVVMLCCAAVVYAAWSLLQKR